MNKGDILLIRFPFTDFSGNKLRPAICLMEENKDVTVCFVTSNLRRTSPTDITIVPTYANGIKVKSRIIPSKIATIDKSFAVGRIGILSEEKLEELNGALKILLELN